MSEKMSPPPPYYPAGEDGPKNEGYPPQAGFQYPPASQDQQSYPPQAPSYGQSGGYPTQQGFPQQPGYTPVASAQTTTVIVAGSGPATGSRPCQVFCPKCHENVITTCEYDSSSMAWIICIILFVTGFCFLVPWFVCWIPFCIDGMKNTIHRCPKCRTHLGTYRGAGI